jgi:hypothetical protein
MVDERNKPNEKVLIMNTERRNLGKMHVKIRSRAYNHFAPDDFRKCINPKNFNELALLFEDLELLAGAPIEKAFRKYKEQKSDNFPF